MQHAHEHGGHHHDHEHDRHHDHAAPAKKPPAGAPTGHFTPGEARQARRLTMVLVLVSLFFVAEFAGARVADSVVLEADAVHLLMDVFALAMSLLAMRLAVRRPTARFTFGLRRAEPVAAVVNAALVLAATVEIVREAIDHLRDAERPKAGIMLVVACGALVVNGLSAWLLHDAIHHSHGHGDAEHHHHDHEDDHAPKKKHHGHALNLRGAWLHLVGDTLGSVAALGAAIAIKMGGPSWADPIASFLVAAILVAGAVRLVRDASVVLLEAAPHHLPVGAIREVVLGFPGVSEVHDLHVWTLGAGHDAITVHVHVEEHARDGRFASRLSAHLRQRFGVEYVTVQVEAAADADCGAPQVMHRE